jgi:hypothetical protein
MARSNRPLRYRGIRSRRLQRGFKAGFVAAGLVILVFIGAGWAVVRAERGGYSWPAPVIAVIAVAWAVGAAIALRRVARNLLRDERDDD